MKRVQCYELFGGIALKNHTFSFSHFSIKLTDYFNQSINISLGLDITSTCVLMKWLCSKLPSPDFKISQIRFIRLCFVN